MCRASPTEALHDLVLDELEALRDLVLDEVEGQQAGLVLDDLVQDQQARVLPELSNLWVNKYVSTRI